jgi:hypothetical protein
MSYESERSIKSHQDKQMIISIHELSFGGFAHSECPFAISSAFMQHFQFFWG